MILKITILIKLFSLFIFFTTHTLYFKVDISCNLYLYSSFYSFLLSLYYYFLCLSLFLNTSQLMKIIIAIIIKPLSLHFHYGTNTLTVYRLYLSLPILSLSRRLRLPWVPEASLQATHAHKTPSHRLLLFLHLLLPTG